MNRPDKAGEPSMEEILASIRQIIADEPRNEPTDAVGANPLVPQSRAPRSQDAPLPLADRLSGVLKSGPLAPTSPFGSKRPLSFDQDLADMFDETESTSSNGVSAPKPDMRVPTELSHPMATKSFVSKEPADKSEDAGNSPSFSSSFPQPIIPPPPVVGFDKTAEPAPPASNPFGFPAMRKTSFYPPQSSAPFAASSPSEPILASPPGAASGEDAPSVPPQHVAEALRRLESGASLVTDASAAEEPSVSWSPEPAAKPEPLAPARETAPSASALSSRTSFSSSFPAAKPSVGAATDIDPGLAPLTSPPPPFSFGAEKSAEAMGGPTFDRSLREPSTADRQTPEHKPFNGSAYDSHSFSPAAKETSAFSDPFGPSVRAAPVSAGNSRFETGPALSADAAHQALDALALGLAASAAGASPSVQPEPLANAIPLTPVFDIPSPPRQAESEAHVQPVPAAAPVAPQPSTLPAPVADVGSMPVNRSLEDAVADMLRPMLQQWVADNMPRIIERALRNEVASALKPGQKSGP